MIVVIEDRVFSSPRTDQTQLVSLLHLGFEGRHRVQVDPLFEPDADQAANRWMERQDSNLRDEIELAFVSGLEESAHGIPARNEVIVADVAAPDWTSSPPRLPLGVAQPLLRQPLKVVLENRRSDWAFLTSVALEPWRDHLDQALERGHVEPTHGGGLTDMVNRAEDLGSSPPAKLRHWFLFDSDALQPEQPSAQSETLRAACEQHGLGHHQLARRASENYLPPQALQAWAHSSSRSARRQRLDKANAFADMSRNQRSHYNMKRGFRGDEDRGIPPLFGQLPRQPELQSGFGSDIARLFLQESFRLRDDWFVRDGQREETQRIVQAIFGAL